MEFMNVCLSAQKARRLTKLFKSKVDDGIPADDLKEANRNFLDEMRNDGFVQELVSSWGYQETTYYLTNIGKEILRLK